MKSKRLIWVAAAFVIVCISISVLPLNRDIDTVVQGVQWKIDEKSYYENVSVSVNGTYSNYLFRKDSFKGNICIDIYGFTYNSQPLDLIFDDGVANLIYNSKNDINNMNTLGFLICTPNFDKLLIAVNTPLESVSNEWSAKDGLVISGKAENREMAVQIAKLLSEKSKWLSNGNAFENE